MFSSIVVLLSVPSAIGVQQALEPTRGVTASWLAAAGFEAVYLRTALLILSAEIRRYAQRVPGGLDHGTAFLATFDWLAMLLSVVECAPLAALAYAMAMLSHRISEEQSVDDDQVAALAAQIAMLTDRIDALPNGQKGKTACPHCGCDLGSMARVAAASRWGHCEHCRPANGHSAASLSETVIRAGKGASV